MRILYLDIDTTRADHLGCYGYHRDTSPNIDRVAAGGVRFDSCYVSDAPCLPSRASMFLGQFGIHTGVINHGGLCADPRPEGVTRDFQTQWHRPSFIELLAWRGIYPVSFSPFAARHSAWWFYSGWREMYNTGKGGMEDAKEVVPLALDWIANNARRDNWMLHVNIWDPHTPYRVPEEFGNPFADQPVEPWYTEELRQRQWDAFGPGSPQEPGGTYGKPFSGLPRQPDQVRNLADYKKWIDGYDCGIRYADQWCGRILNALADQGVLDDTIVIITSDHGENMGELGVIGDHAVADHITSRVPMIVRWPGAPAARVDKALHYQTDVAATLVELLGGEVPPHWDGQSFASSFAPVGSVPVRASKGEAALPLSLGGRGQGEGVGTPGSATCAPGRDFLVVSQNAWSCQRAVRWGDHMMIRSYHTGLKNYPARMLFNVAADPHEQSDLAPSQPALADHGQALLEQWTTDMLSHSANPTDPMLQVLAEGGPYHTRSMLTKYCQRLRETNRPHHADFLEKNPTGIV